MDISEDPVTTTHVEEALRSSEARFRALFENSYDGIALVDSDGRIMDASASTTRLFGYSHSELVGRDAIELIHPEDREYVRGRLTECLTRPGEPVIAEYRVRHRDGSWRYVEGVGVNRLLEMGVGAIVVNFRDVTERQEAARSLHASHDLLQAVIESSADAIFARDRRGRYVLVNSSAARMLGRSPRELIGHIDAEFFPPEFARTGRTSDARVMERGTSEVTETTAVLGGENRLLLITRNPLRDRAGETVGVLVIARDITEQRQLEDQLYRKKQMDTVARLAGGIAHDFNNLLTVIHGSAEILMHDLPEAYARRSDLEQIKVAASRAAELTRQVLAFSRQQVLAPRFVDLDELMSQMKSRMLSLLGGQIDLDLRLSETGRKGEGGLVRVDPAQFEQAVQILVANARDAMPNGGRLTITTGTEDLTDADVRDRAPMPAGRYRRVMVTDTGVGMDEPTLAQVFEPFFTTKPGVHGVGLGLAMTYGIVKQSGGFIWATSQPGVGSTFSIYLPWQPAPAAVPGAPVPEPAAETGGRETILLVDDEPAVRLVTKQILLRNGYSVLEAANGAQALQVLTKHPRGIHLLLTDVIMPGMHGPELAQQVCAQRPDIRVLFMSAYSPEAITKDGVLAEGAQFLRKPFDIRTLLQTVREALQPTR